MRIIALRTLREYWRKYPSTRSSIELWYFVASRADWSGPGDVKRDFAAASVIADNRVVFNIAGNRCRLVVKFNYDYRIGYVRFIGTHAQYDRIDATIV